MPIYEFHCIICNRIYQFFSRTVNTEKIPKCPKCKNPKLERIMSGFATVAGRNKEDDSDMGMPPIDDSRMDKAMEMLARNADKIDEDDPRQVVKLMRELSDATGLKMRPEMEEALNRLERGEDPDRIEEEMGDLLQKEEPFLPQSKKEKRVRKTKSEPKRDDTLYEL